jgi:glycerol-3-phosphate dehydrogenase (NAD(P)+)
LYKRISIIGAGTWGIAIANHLSSKARVEVFHYRKEFLEEIEKNKTHANIPNFIIPESVKFSYSNSIDSDLCIIAVPVQNIISVLNNFKIKEKIPILMLSKGIENKTLQFPLDLILDSDINLGVTAILSGPSHAEQVIMKHPTSVVVASEDMLFSSSLQKLFSNTYFRTYANSDVRGVQVGGAVKNVISIASGMLEGLGYKENTTSALLTRGLHEIKKLGAKLKAKEETFNGLTGLGDLMVTAFSRHSRNRMVGINISKGIPAKETIRTINMEAEGVYTSKSVFKLAQKFEIEMPICCNVYNIIYNNKDPKIAIEELMTRKLKRE